MHNSYLAIRENNAKMYMKNRTAVMFIDLPYYEDDFVISEKLEKKFGKLTKL